MKIIMPVTRNMAWALKDNRTDITLGTDTATIDLTQGVPPITIDDIQDIVLSVDAGVQPKSKYAKIDANTILFESILPAGTVVSIIGVNLLRNMR